jgi:hypothetical protein
MIRRLLGTAVLALGLTLAGCGQDINNKYGTLKLTIEGLPAGAKGKVTVKGTGFEKTFEANSDISLLAGTYTISGESVKSASDDYDVAVNPATVVVGEKSESVAKATYSKTSSLTITISGLPNGVNAGVLVKGKTPSTFSETVNATKTFTSVKPGDYEITAVEITSGADKYGAKITPATVTVGAGEAKESTVVFTKIDQGLRGSISLSVTGLSAGTNPKITITGPNEYSNVINTIPTTPITNLPGGTYTITTAEVDSVNFATNYLVFVPAETTKQITIVDTTPISYTVAYSENFSFASKFTASAGDVFSSRETPTGGYTYVYSGAPYDATTNPNCATVGTIKYAKYEGDFIFDAAIGSVSRAYNFDGTGCYTGFALGFTAPGAPAVGFNLSVYKQLKIRVSATSADATRKLKIIITDPDANQPGKAGSDKYPTAVITTNSTIQEYTVNLSTADFAAGAGAPNLTTVLSKVKAIDVLDSEKPGTNGYLANPRSIKIESIQLVK